MAWKRVKLSSLSPLPPPLETKLRDEQRLGVYLLSIISFGSHQRDVSSLIHTINNIFHLIREWNERISWLLLWRCAREAFLSRSFTAAQHKTTFFRRRVAVEVNEFTFFRATLMMFFVINLSDVRPTSDDDEDEPRRRRKKNVCEIQFQL